MGFPWAYDKGQQTPCVTSPDSKKSKNQAMLSNSMCLLVSMVDTLWGESYSLWPGFGHEDSMFGIRIRAHKSNNKHQHLDFQVGHQWGLLLLWHM